MGLRHGAPRLFHIFINKINISIRMKVNPATDERTPLLPLLEADHHPRQC